MRSRTNSRPQWRVACCASRVSGAPRRAGAGPQVPRQGRRRLGEGLGEDEGVPARRRRMAARPRPRLRLAFAVLVRKCLGHGERLRELPRRGARPLFPIAAMPIAWSFNSRAREGRDSRATSTYWGSSEFQFTRPRGARPFDRRFRLEWDLVSIHAPAWGATRRRKRGLAALLPDMVLEALVRRGWRRLHPLPKPGCTGRLTSANLRKQFYQDSQANTTTNRDVHNADVSILQGGYRALAEDALNVEQEAARPLRGGERRGGRRGQRQSRAADGTGSCSPIRRTG